jgi:hypothetical protein
MSKEKSSSWRAALVLMMVTLISPGFAKAYCPGSDSTEQDYDPVYYSVSNEMARAYYVVVGRVISEIWLGEDGKPKPLQPPFQEGRPRPWGFDPYSGAMYKIKVLRNPKGKPNLYVSLFSENSTSRFWLDVGSEYVFFVSEETFEDPVGRKLTIDTCGNSVLVNKADAVLKSIANDKREQSGPNKSFQPTAPKDGAPAE